MAHAEGWIQAYGFLENGQEIPKDLLAIVLSNRSGLGETMLHWYAIEGASDVLEKIVALGFDVNTTNEFGQTPLFESVIIGRWDNVEVLLKHGADPTVRNQNDETIYEYLEGKPDSIKRLKELTKGS
jgi:ankyrin repeat protein